MSYFINNILILLIFNSFILSSLVKNNKNNHKFTSKIDECKAIEECQPCTFDELKTIDECQVTGYKKKIQCLNKNNEQKVYNEPCSENRKINSVYIFLIICIAIFIISYRYQKTQKDSTLKNLMVKLSILKN